MVFDLREHLLSRYVDFSRHTVYMSGSKATFMLYNLSGQIVGYQQYNPLAPDVSSNAIDGRYYTRRSKHISIFGLETLKEDTRILFITEGIFDAMRLTSKGCSCIALLTNAPNSSMKNLLECLPYRKVLVADNDKGGAVLISALKYIVSEVIIPPYKDLGNAPEEYVRTITTNYLD